MIGSSGGEEQTATTSVSGVDMTGLLPGAISRCAGNTPQELE